MRERMRLGDRQFLDQFAVLVEHAGQVGKEQQPRAFSPGNGIVSGKLRPFRPHSSMA